MRMMILEQLDEHRMLKHKGCDVLIVVSLMKNIIIAALDKLYNKRWQETNLVFENTSQPNERWQERMVWQDKMKTINESLDVMPQVFENMSQPNERWQERTVRQDKMKTINESLDAMP